VNTVRLSQARRLFASPFVPRHVNRQNARRWVGSLRFLGPKWVGLTNKDGIQAVEKDKEFS
jgi:hypothetical protein